MYFTQAIIISRDKLINFKEISEHLNERGYKDFQGEKKEASKYSFNVKPHNDTAEKNENSDHIIKKGKVEENKETGTGSSQVRKSSVLNVKSISESTLVIETADRSLYCRFTRLSYVFCLRKLVSKNNLNFGSLVNISKFTNQEIITPDF